MIYKRTLLTNDKKMGKRIQRQDFVLYMYRSFLINITWRASFFNNGALFYGNKKYKKWFFEDLNKNASKLKNISEFHYFSFQKQELKNFDKNNSNIHCHYYSYGFEKFIEDIKLYCNDIKNSMLKNNLLEPINQKIIFLVIDYDSITNDDCKNNLENFSKLLLDSSASRVYLFLLSRDIHNFHGELWETLEWISYFSKINTSFAETAYQKLNLIQNPKWFTDGIVWQKGDDNFYKVCPWNHRERSEFYTKNEAYYNEHDKAYEKFLKSLDDGS